MRVDKLRVDKREYTNLEDKLTLITNVGNDNIFMVRDGFIVLLKLLLYFLIFIQFEIAIYDVVFTGRTYVHSPHCMN